MGGRSGVAVERSGAVGGTSMALNRARISCSSAFSSAESVRNGSMNYM